MVLVGLALLVSLSVAGCNPSVSGAVGAGLVPAHCRAHAVPWAPFPLSVYGHSSDSTWSRKGSKTLLHHFPILCFLNCVES